MKDTLRTYESIFGLLPDVDNPTPLVRLNHVPGFDHTEVFAKLDRSFAVGGSPDHSRLDDLY